MNKVISLEFGQGCFKNGFSPIKLQIYAGEKPVKELNACLPPFPEMEEEYLKWHYMYESLMDYNGSFLGEGLSREHREFAPRAIEFSESGVERGSQGYAEEVVESLLQTLNKWLDSPDFLAIDRALRDNISPQEEAVLVIQTDSDILRKLPWHEWDFLKSRKIEVALSTPQFDRQIIKNYSPQGKVRILAIVGDCRNVTAEADLEILRSHREIDLEIIERPVGRYICDRLREKPGWDIIFYTGHGGSNGGDGWLDIAPGRKLKISEFNSALKVAIENGLQAAIFNSCQGLGLVPHLDKLGIPQIIVMREKVPNLVAEEFLRQFIDRYSRGESFYAAIREARDRLKDLEIEGEYYCASWLPIVCQHRYIKALSWSELRDRGSPKVFPKKAFIASSLLASITVIGLRSLGLLQSWEFQSFDFLMRMRPDAGRDSRLLIVEATETDVNKFGFPIPDGKLAESIRLIKRYQPTTMGLLMFRDRPIQPGHSELLKYLQNDDSLIALCSLKSADRDLNQPGIPSPLGVPESRLGFSNSNLDTVNGILRRQLLFASPDLSDRCPTRFSFSFQLASQYLNYQGMPPEVIDSDTIKIGDTIINRLRADTGAYHQLDDRGFQILLNYRTCGQIANTISLGDVLENKLTPELVKNKIVIIGIVAPISNATNYFSTPYSQGVLPQMSGVYIEAQMTSQIISAVLDKRPLLWSLSKTGEWVWIAIWSVLGSGIAIAISRDRSYFRRIVSIAGAIFILHIICFLALLQGLWLPLIPTAMSLAIASISGIILLKNKYFIQQS